jgi:hypothetical protein
MAAVPAGLEPSTPRIRIQSVAAMPAPFILFQTMNMLQTHRRIPWLRDQLIIKTARTIETSVILTD